MSRLHENNGAELLRKLTQIGLYLAIGKVFKTQMINIANIQLSRDEIESKRSESMVLSISKDATNTTNNVKYGNLNNIQHQAILSVNSSYVKFFCTSCIRFLLLI